MRMLGLVAVAAALFVFAGLAAACDDDGTALSLEEYFQQLDEAQNGIDARFAEQEEGGPEPGPDDTDEEIASLLRDNVQGSADIVRDGESDIDSLEPPSEVEDAHNRLVQAVGDSADALDAYVEQLPDAISLEELESADETFFSSPELDAAFMALEEACIALQTIADDNSIAVDLECEE